jgi:hypothetical protein
MADNKTYKDVLEFLKTVEANSPDLLNADFTIFEYLWDTGETRVVDIENIAIDRGRIDVKTTVY